MAYAGVQFMVLAMQSKKADLEAKAIDVTRELTKTNRTANNMVKEYNLDISEIDLNDPSHEDLYNERRDQFELDMRDITAWEDQLDQEKTSLNAQIALADKNISTWTEAMKQGISKSHTYGAQQ